MKARSEKATPPARERRSQRVVHVEEPAKPLLGRRYVICNWRDSSHPRAGGAEVYCQRVATELGRLGAEITLVTSRPRGAPRRESAPYGQVVRLGGTYSTYPLALLWLARWGRRSDGVIDSENGIPYFSPLAVGRRVPVVLLMHHVHQEQFGLYFPPVARTLARWLERSLAGRVYGRRAICAVSPSTRTLIRRQLNLRGPIFIAPNGLDRGPDSRSAARERTPWPSLVYVGRLVAHKQVELLVRVVPGLLELFPQLRVEVIGDGPERHRLQRLAADLGLSSRISFRGRLDDQTRDQLVSRSWLGVNPSAGEGWGLSVMESAALGVPTVALRVPGLADSVLDGHTGWLCDSAGDLGSAVAAALGRLEDAEAAAEVARACVAWAAKFSWPSTAASLHAVLSSEGDRLANGYQDRRRRNDAYSLVSVPPGTAPVPPEALRALRRTDGLRLAPGGRLQLLLANADELDAARALARLWAASAVGWEARLARPADLLGWEPVTRAEAVLGGWEPPLAGAEGPHPVIDLTEGVRPRSPESVLPLRSVAEDRSG